MPFFKKSLETPKNISNKSVRNSANTILYSYEKKLMRNRALYSELEYPQLRRYGTISHVKYAIPRDWGILIPKLHYHMLWMIYFCSR